MGTSEKGPHRIAIIALIVAGFLASRPALVQADPNYLDANLPVEERVDDLLSRMTLDEKIGQMTQCSSGESPSTVTSYYIGSVLSGGHQGPGGTKAHPRD